MKNSKAIYVTVQDIKGDVTHQYRVFTKRIAKPDRDYQETCNKSNKDFSCQYDSKKCTTICTCKKAIRRESRYFSTSRQVYRSHSTPRDFRDIGVGSVKSLPKRRVRKVLLPETEDRGVGSSDLIPFTWKTRKWSHSSYDQKKTSSKCVGSGVEYKNMCILSEKLSPIYQSRSVSTSPKQVSFEEHKHIDGHHVLKDQAINLKHNIQDHTMDKHKVQTTSSTHENAAHTIQADKNDKKSLPVANIIKLSTATAANYETDFSSDSLVQYVHNLETLSAYKQSETSFDLIKNRLQSEYGNIFKSEPKTCKPTADVKPIPDFKSISILRRRFEGLRRSKLNKNEDYKNDCVVVKTSSQASILSKKDVSIASDPPSLEGRSYTKVYNPTPSPLHQQKTIPETSYKKSAAVRKGSWSTDVVDSDCQNVKGMFQLWGKKFDLEGDHYKKPAPNNSLDATMVLKKKVEPTHAKEVIEKDKKEGKRFSFFKRKGRDKSKHPYKSKKGVTAGRCEVGDGLMIKMGATNEFPVIIEEKSELIPDAHDDILRNAWLKRFLTNKIDSRNRVHKRWNNDMYTTSSSTVFELLESVYKNNNIVLKSKSDVTIRDSAWRYPSHITPLVNFMQQSIETWMIPKMITDNKTGKCIPNSKIEKKKNIEVKYSNQKWLIDKSKAFPQNIEIILHSNNFVQSKKDDSTEYIMIDIPKGYFSESSNDNEVQNQTSDEQVYNIVEYETANSSSCLNYKREMDIGDHETNDVDIAAGFKNLECNESKIQETVIKRPPLHRDVVVQGSNVYVPKRGNVIGVGIITQRDVRYIKKTILKMRDEITDNDYANILPQRKCELAESYLQDFYRHWNALGTELFSWCVSDYRLRVSSNNSLSSFNKPGDGSKSCPNIYDDFHMSTVVSSCATSSCSHCIAVEDEKKVDNSQATTFFSRFRKKSLDPLLPPSDGKRVLPKDSLEVFKRRKIYAASNKSNWGVNDDIPEPYSVPSIEDKGAQNTLIECPKVMKPGCKESKSKKKYKKHVSLQDCDIMNEILKGQLSGKLPEGILSFKRNAGCDICKSKETECAKHASVIPDPICEIPQPPCVESCTKVTKPPCLKKNSVICHVPPPLYPTDASLPCQPKGCALSPAGKSSPRPTKSQSTCSQTCTTPTCSCSNSTPPRVHTPQLSAQRLTKLCACIKKISPIKTPVCTQNHPTQCKSSDKNLNRRSSREFPWPLKNQMSKTPSPKSSGMSLKPSSKQHLPPNNCTAGLKRLIQKLSNSSMKRKVCVPDCENRPKVPFSSSPPPAVKTVPPTKNRNQPKITGVHLRQKPMVRGNECESFCNEEIIRLNSKERMLIKRKQKTPSTEAIREGCNFKVQDEDGQTLYERVNYKKADKLRTHLVTDMYRDSQIQRVSTSNTDTIMDENMLESYEGKSNTSLSIEINFNVKFKQGDKPTEVNIRNCGDTQKKVQSENVNANDEIYKELYILEDKAKESIERTENTDKKNVNIKIVIKNYQQTASKSKETTKNCTNLHSDDFSRKISEKFQTVSTEFNDVLEQQTCSIHRTIINVSNSCDESILLIRPSKELVNKELTEQSPINLAENVSETKRSAAESSVNLNKTNDSKNEECLQKDISQINLSDATSASLRFGNLTLDNNEALFSDLQNSNNEIPKIYNKEEKKKILKQIFEDANDNNKTPNKSRMQSIRQMLRAVLSSDSSEHEDLIYNNELAEELTYESLKPNFFKDCDSMSNYYRLGSSISLNRHSNNASEEILYPTEQNNSEYSDESNANEKLGCLCSRLAEKLNVYENNNIKPCCCRGVAKSNKDVACNLIEEVKKDKVDVEIQNSKDFPSNHGKVFVTIAPKAVTGESHDTRNENEDINKLSNRKVSYSTSFKTCLRRKINRQTVLGLSDDDKVIVINSNSESHSQIQERDRYRKTIKPIDILQLNETKKAVLEIYAESNVSDKQNIIARLPKFVGNQDNEIRNYQKSVKSFQHINKRKVVIMSVTR